MRARALGGLARALAHLARSARPLARRGRPPRRASARPRGTPRAPRQVREVVELTPDKSALTDLLLVKLATKVVGTRARIVELSNLFRAEVLDVSADELLIKVADSPTKVDSFLKLMDKFEISPAWQSCWTPRP